VVKSRQEIIQFIYSLTLSIKSTKMSVSINEDIIKKWVNCFNVKDLDTLLSLYAEDAVHVSPKLRVKQPETEGKIKGKENLRNWWKDAFERYTAYCNITVGVVVVVLTNLYDRLPDLKYDIITITANIERAFLEYKRTTPGEPG
jgi:hypothetical protein